MSVSTRLYPGVQYQGYGPPFGVQFGQKGDKYWDTSATNTYYICTQTGTTSTALWQIIGTVRAEDESRLLRKTLYNVSATDLLNGVQIFSNADTVLPFRITNFVVAVGSTPIVVSDNTVYLQLAYTPQDGGGDAIIGIPISQLSRINTQMSLVCYQSINGGSGTVYSSFVSTYMNVPITLDNTTTISAGFYNTGLVITGGPFTLSIEYSFS